MHFSENWRKTSNERYQVKALIGFLENDKNYVKK
jgi:hypothetical protein